MALAKVLWQKEGYLGGLEPRKTTKSHHATDRTQEIYLGLGVGIQKLPLSEGGGEERAGHEGMDFIRDTSHMHRATVGMCHPQQLLLTWPGCCSCVAEGGLAGGESKFFLLPYYKR